jgi:hypothetical protein
MFNWQAASIEPLGLAAKNMAGQIQGSSSRKDSSIETPGPEGETLFVGNRSAADISSR